MRGSEGLERLETRLQHVNKRRKHSHENFHTRHASSVNIVIILTPYLNPFRRIENKPVPYELLKDTLRLRGGKLIYGKLFSGSRPPPHASLLSPTTSLIFANPPSPLQLTNSTPKQVAFILHHVTISPTEHLVSPNTTISVPPTISSSATSISSSTSPIFPLLFQRPESFPFSNHILRITPPLQATLHNAISIKNSLPLKIDVKIQIFTATIRLSDLAPGSTHPLVDIDPEEALRLSVKFSGTSTWTEQIFVDLSSEAFTLSTMSGQTNLSILVSSTPAFKLTIYSECIILDKTSCNFSFSSSPVNKDPIVDGQTTHRTSTGPEFSEGEHGLTVYKPSSNIFRVRIDSYLGKKISSKWSLPLDLSTPHTKTPIKIQSTVLVFDLIVTITTPPKSTGIDKLTSLITIAPNYVLTNLTAFDLTLTQSKSPSTHDSSSIKSFKETSSPLYFRTNEPKRLYFSETSKNLFSEAFIRPSHLGVDAFRLLPGTDVLQSEVKAGQANDDFSIQVVLWSTGKIPGRSLYEIKNESSSTVIIRSKDSLLEPWVIRPSTTEPFGFDCGTETVLQWKIERSRGWYEVDTRKLSVRVPLEISVPAIPSVELDDRTIVISFVDRGKESKRQKKKRQNGKPKAFGVTLPLVSISLVDNVSQGRELLLISITGSQFDADISSKRGECRHKCKFTVKDCQIDNFVPQTYHPILLFPRNTGDDTNGEPFLKVATSFDEKYSIQSLIVKMRPMVLALDSTTVLSLNQARKLVTSLLSKSNSSPLSLEMYALELVNCALSHDVGHKLVDEVEFSNLSKASLSTHVALQKLIFYPQDFVLTFTAVDSAHSTLLEDTQSVESATIHIRGFKSTNLFITTSELRQTLLHHYKTEAKENMYYIIGSLAALGAPTELVNRVGDGVNKFLFSPFDNEDGFVAGIDEGIRGLKSGVVGGVAKSIGMVGESFLGRFAELSGDTDYLYEREVQRRSSKGRDTFTNMTASIGLGFVSSINAITSMIEMEDAPEAKIVGLAIAGLFVKPIVGVGDSVAGALKNLGEDGTRDQMVQRRSRKVLMRVDGGTRFVILPFDEYASMAEEVVDCGGTVVDRYVHHVVCSSQLMIFSEHCLWLLDREDPSRNILCTSYHDISHFRGVKRNGAFEIHVYSYSMQGLIPIMVEADGAPQRDEIFTHMKIFSGFMGNVREKGYGQKCEILGGNIFGRVNFRSEHEEEFDNNDLALFNCTGPKVRPSEERKFERSWLEQSDS